MAKHLDNLAKSVLGETFEFDEKIDVDWAWIWFEGEDNEPTLKPDGPYAPTNRIANVQLDRLSDTEYRVIQSQAVDFSDPEDAYSDVVHKE